ncbi:MAG: polysaccharide deacetylase family protein [Verrucomicrobia bacterium]|nr:polysaccharide deacetylase family protein [Verrucomicrobiota bacterium]
MNRPPATLSLDLDNLWSYLKTHGDPGWESFPSFLDRATERILPLLGSMNLRITFFLVGKDAALEKNAAALRAIADAGHEIASHSHWHVPHFPSLDRSETIREIEMAENAILTATGVRPTGWRGPSFSFSTALVETLAARGYAYDATIFPTFLGPLARLYFFATSKLSRQERQERSDLFGGLANGFRPNRPFRWALGDGSRLLEIPVTTVPGVRAPFHASYLHYLATFSEPAARAYLTSALTLCRGAGVPPSFLLHPTDFLGGEDVPELKYFPGMTASGATKEKRTRDYLARLTQSFEVVPLGSLAASLQGAALRSLPLPGSGADATASSPLFQTNTANPSL